MVNVTTTITPEIKAEWIDYCKEHDMKLSQLVRIAVKEYLASRK